MNENQGQSKRREDLDRAIRKELCCTVCDAIGMWWWASGDHNPDVWVCDEHKMEPFGTHESGPWENASRRTVSDYYKAPS